MQQWQADGNGSSRGGTRRHLVDDGEGGVPDGSDGDRGRASRFVKLGSESDSHSFVSLVCDSISQALLLRFPSLTSS